MDRTALLKFAGNVGLIRRWATTVGAELDHVYGIKDLKPMHVVAAFGLYSMAAILHENGAQVVIHAKSWDGRLPLHFLGYSPR